MSLPVFVTRIRFAKPLRVLILGTGCGLVGNGLSGNLSGGLGSSLPAWREDHEEVLALEERRPFHDREWPRVVRHPIQNPSPDVLVDHLPTSEHDRHFHLFACFKELLQTFELRLEIVLRHLWSKLHLLQLDDVLLPPLILLPLDGLELESSVVHQPADGRARLRGHLYKVESLLASDAQSGVEGEHP